ncbi:hypothetical protein [Salinimicrobium gaetbulicola]|uniref:Competence protein CoiA-like protein n=1 Tax=Salinimicrobium gaetbulicola TaxID=999702 RepID=A0ABW3IFA5_9FLAO
MPCTEYPVALKKGTNDLAEIKEVPNGKACNCYCFYCKGDLIAVNREENVVADHFKHYPGSNCSLSFETYLHWLTKKIFEKFDFIKLPAITFKDLYVKYWCFESPKIKKIRELFSKYNLPEEFRDIIQYEFDLNVSNQFKIELCTTEKRLKNEKDQIQPDILLKLNSMDLLVEPYVTSKINARKLGKIKEIDISTLSIDLNTFRKENKLEFTEEDLTNYLLLDSCKEWLYLSKSFREELFKEFMSLLEKRLNERISMVQDYANHESQIEINGKEMKSTQDTIEQLERKIRSLESVNSDLASKRRLCIRSIYSY